MNRRPDKAKRQHDGGRLTVRQRIEKPVDPGSFHEIGAIGGKAEYNGLTELVPPNCVFGTQPGWRSLASTFSPA